MFNFVKKWWFSKAATQTVVRESNLSGVVWSDENFENFAKEAYLRSIIAFRCINEIAKSVASVPWGVFRLDSEGKKVPVLNHPITKILKRPNPEEGWSFFIQKMWSFYKLDGNTFIHKISPMSGPNRTVPQELRILRPDRMKILEDGGRLIGFEHKIGMRDPDIFLIDQITQQADVLQIKTFHPTDDWWGAAATKVAAREIDTGNEAVVWNKSLLENQGRPGLIYNFKSPLENKEYKRFKTRLAEQFAGPKNAGKDIIVDGEAEVKPYGFTMNDLDFMEGQQELARRVCIAYDVPPVVIGIADATFNNEAEGRLRLWEGPVTHDLSLMQDEFNNWFFIDDEIFVAPILDEVPALALARQRNWDRANASDFLTINQKLEMVGKEPDPDGDVILVSATLIPLKLAIAPPEEPPDNSTNDDFKKSVDITGVSDYE